MPEITDEMLTEIKDSIKQLESRVQRLEKFNEEIDKQKEDIKKQMESIGSDEHIKKLLGGIMGSGNDSEDKVNKLLGK